MRRVQRGGAFAVERRIVAETRLGVLDGLRGIAVLLVLWYHVWEISWLPAPLPWLQFVPETGFVGVDLFFFISGFVIVYPFVRAARTGEAPPRWGTFFYRRGIKIVPSYLLSIALLIAIGYAHFSSPAQAARDVVTHVLFVHTWWSDTYGSINGVLWTLAVEVEFYAIFPLLWWAFSRAPFVTAAVMTAFSIAYRLEAIACCLQTHAEQLVYNLPGYLDVFAAGMMGAYLFVRLRDRSEFLLLRSIATVVAIAGFAGLILLLQNLWSVRAEPAWATVWNAHYRTLIALAFFTIAAGSLLAYRRFQQILANPVLLFLAVISYNLYLYHQAFARLLLAWRLPPYATADPHLDPVWQVRYTVVALGLTVIQAAAVTYLFERPLLRLRPAFLRPASRRGHWQRGERESKRL